MDERALRKNMLLLLFQGLEKYLKDQIAGLKGTDIASGWEEDVPEEVVPEEVVRCFKMMNFGIQQLVDAQESLLLIVEVTKKTIEETM